MIFVDTGAWFAQFVTADANHAAAVAWMAQNRQPLITTDYIVDETLTLLKARGQDAVALALGQQFFEGFLTQIHYLTQDDLRQMWETFRRFSDKEWSFTDCASKVVMEKLGLMQAFAFDQHFRQFGTVAVVP